MRLFHVPDGMMTKKTSLILFLFVLFWWIFVVTTITNAQTSKDDVQDLEIEHIKYGLLVDETIGILTIETKEIIPLPRSIPGIKREYYQGINKGKRDLTIILDSGVTLKSIQALVHK